MPSDAASGQGYRSNPKRYQKARPRKVRKKGSVGKAITRAGKKHPVRLVAQPKPKRVVRAKPVPKGRRVGRAITKAGKRKNFRLAKPVKKKDLKVAGINLDRITGAGGRAALDILEETTRPVHGIAAGTREQVRLAKKGELRPWSTSVPKAFVAGLRNKRKDTFSDVLKEAGAPKALRGLGASKAQAEAAVGGAGFAADVLLDPLTYVGAGATVPAKVAAKTAGLKAAQKATEKGLSKKAVKKAKSTASRKAFREGDKRKKVSVSFGGAKKVTPINAPRLRPGARDRLSKTFPVRPSNIREEDWAKLQSADRRRRGTVLSETRRSARRAIAVRRGLGGAQRRLLPERASAGARARVKPRKRTAPLEASRRVRDALEQGKLAELPPQELAVAKEVVRENRRLIRMRKGAGEKPKVYKPREPGEPKGYVFRQAAKAIDDPALKRKVGRVEQWAKGEIPRVSGKPRTARKTSTMEDFTRTDRRPMAEIREEAPGRFVEDIPTTMIAKAQKDIGRAANTAYRKEVVALGRKVKKPPSKKVKKSSLPAREEFVAARPKPSRGVEPPTVKGLTTNVPSKGKPGVRIEDERIRIVDPKTKEQVGWGNKVPGYGSPVVTHRDESGKVTGALSMVLDKKGQPSVMEIAVDPAARRQGIARKLVAAAHEAGYDVERAYRTGGLTEEGAHLSHGLLKGREVARPAGGSTAAKVKVREDEAVYRIDKGRLTEVPRKDAPKLANTKPSELVVLKRAVADHANEQIAVRKRIPFIDPVTNRVKWALTIPNPQYWSRNYYGGMYNAWAEGASAAGLAKALPSAHKVARRQGKIAKAEETLGAAPKKPAGKIDLGKAGSKDVDEFIGELEKVNVSGGGITSELLGAETRRRSKMQVFEDAPRLAAYIHWRRKGLTPDKATDRAMNSQFDYGLLTGVETNVARRIFPFYTWRSRNVVLQGKTLVQRPGKLATVQKAREELGKGMPPDWESKLTEGESLGVPVPVPGTSQLLFPGLPVTDLNLFTASPSALGQQAMGSVNPLVKAPLEFWTGYNFFFRDKIEREGSKWYAAPDAAIDKLPSPMRKALIKRGVLRKGYDRWTNEKTWQWRGKADYIAKLTPFTSTLFQAGTSGRSRKGQKKEQRIATWLTGLRTQPFAPEQNRLFKLYEEEQKVRDKIDDLTELRINKVRKKGVPRADWKPTKEYKKLQEEAKRLSIEVFTLERKLGKKDPRTDPRPKKVRRSGGGGSDYWNIGGGKPSGKAAPSTGGGYWNVD